MRPRYTLLMALAFAFLALFALPSEPTDAEIGTSTYGNTVLSKEIVLEEDMVFRDGSVIRIDPGTKIDMSVYNLDFGENSRIAITGSLEIISSYGHIIIGNGSTLVLTGAAVPKTTTDVTMSFDGTLMIEGSLGTTEIGFTPANDDDCILIEWDKSSLSVESPTLTQTVDGNSTNTLIGFTKMVSVKNNYDGDDLISVETAVYTAEDTERTIEIHTYSNGSSKAAIMIGEYDITVKYTNKDSVSHSNISGIGVIDVVVDSKKQATLTGNAEKAVFEKIEKEKTEWHLEANELDLTMECDLTLLVQILLPFFAETTTDSDVLRYLNLTADDSTIIRAYEDDIHLTDLSVTIDASSSAEHYLVAKATNGSVDYTICMGNPVFESFSLSRTLVMDGTVYVPYVTLTAMTDGKLNHRMDATDIYAELNDLDVKALYQRFSTSGTITVQDIIDNSNRAYVKATSITVDSDGDGNNDGEMKDLDCLLVENAMGLNTMSLGFSEMDMPVTYGEGTAQVRLDKTILYMESVGSLSECLDAFLGKIDFSTDTHSEIQISNGGLSIEYTEDNTDITMISEKSSGTSPTYASIILTLDHSMYLDKTTIEGKLSSVGYTVTTKVHKDYTEPEGTMDTVVIFNDVSASFSMGFGETVSFGLDIHAPWSLDIQYYDIDFQIDGEDSIITLTHGYALVDGFDSSREGILDFFYDMIKNDYQLETRLSVTSEEILIYRDSRQTLYNDYKDLDLEVRKVVVDMDRDNELYVGLNRAMLSVVLTDDTILERTLGHLDFKKDLSGTVPPEDPMMGLYVALQYIFALSFIGLLVYLIRLRLTRPELFRFNDSLENGEGKEEEDLSSRKSS